MRTYFLLFTLVAALCACAPGKSHYRGGGFGPSVYVPDYPPVPQGKDSKKLSRDEMWERFAQWSDYLKERLKKGKAVGPAEFDRFFNDSYFRGDFNSIKELEEARSKLSTAFRHYDGGEELQRSLDYWAKQRLGQDDYNATVTELGDRVSVALEVPGLNERSINLNITDTAILFSFETSRSGAKTQMKVFPVPDSARPGSQRVSVSGDTLRIVFARKSGR